MKNKLVLKDIFIIILASFLTISLMLIEGSKVLVKDNDYELKYEASNRMAESLEEIKKEKIRRKIEIDSFYDINHTGIIGEEFNGVTTTLGSLESKRTSANPNFAAVIVDMLLEAGLKPGDSIAANFSSSFPALNIATIIACEVLDLNPIIITSIGSSTWGGNNLDFTYLDMESHLYNKGFIDSQSIAASPGGATDIGKDMNQEDLKIIIDRIQATGKEIIIEDDLSANIELRYNLYMDNSKGIKCFINVGGNVVSFGDTMDSLDTSVGLVDDIDYTISDKSGLVQRFQSENIPIIHLLNIKELSQKYGLKVDSDYPYIVGEGDVYYSYSYPYKLIIFILILSLVSLIIYRRRIKKHEKE